MVKLVISDSEGATTVVPLVRDEISIGRKEGNTIRLTERNVSRKHAQLKRVNGSYKLKDLNSYVGTLINGARVEVEAEVQAGDTIQIGDYRIQVEREGQVEEAPAHIEDELTRVTKARMPARLVVLGPPFPGKEFALPEEGAIRIGRGEELAVWLDHPSVSREHAEIEYAADGFHLRDLGSANGLRMRGERVYETTLGTGDVIELGRVHLRFVPSGEAYEFDPNEVALYQAPPSRSGLWIGVALAVVGVIAAVVIASSGDEEAPEPVAAPAVVAPAAAPTPAAEPPPEPAAAPAPTDDGYVASLADCEAALLAGRFVEAIAHANAAVAARAGAPEAAKCRADAQRGADQEQAFVRGNAALEGGDVEGALREFASIDPASPFRGRPEVAEAIEGVGSKRVAAARAALSRDPEEAARVAASVLAVPGMPQALQSQARQVLTRAQVAAPTPRAQAAARPASTKSGGLQPSGGGKRPMEAASDCLSLGDNECVIRALRGRASTAQELGLLIETYRAMGAVDEAQKQMAIYVKRFPTARRAEAYQKMLGRGD